VKKNNGNFIGSIYSIIPFNYKKRGVTVLLISILNQIVDFISILLLVPIFISITNPNYEFKTANPFFSFILYFKDYQFELLAGVVLFYILKNYLSIKILQFLSDYYYELSNSLSVTLLENYYYKTLLEVKAERNSTLVKDMVFVPNNFVIYVLSSIIQFISESFLILLILIVALLINPLATFFLMGITMLIILCLYSLDRRQLSKLNDEISEKYNTTFNHLLNAVNGYVEIKINQMEAFFLQKFNHSNQTLNKMHSQLNTNRLIKPKHTELFLIVLISILFIISKFMNKDSQVNVVFISFLFASTLKIVPSINRILISITNLKANLHTIDILKKNEFIVDQKTIPEETITFTKSIVLQNIAFSYNDSKPLLKDINLTLKKGEIIGIKGNSGKGKSTLINIITTLITPISGTIQCDSKTINTTNKKSYLEFIAYVPQSPFILEGTLLENISLNDAQINFQLLDEYLALFELKDIIDALPNKLNTYIGSNGYNLSGGQIQRLALIRSLIRKPQLLILDEALNQMDTDLKSKIIEVLKTISKKQNITLIIVSHNENELKTICDAVYELKNSSLILKKC
jgi:ABC-type bacteriocin/lantibiotic exporter with double-glycine peptidase domain